MFHSANEFLLLSWFPRRFIQLFFHRLLCTPHCGAISSLGVVNYATEEIKLKMSKQSNFQPKKIIVFTYSGCVVLYESLRDFILMHTRTGQTIAFPLKHLLTSLLLIWTQQKILIIISLRENSMYSYIFMYLST